MSFISTNKLHTGRTCGVKLRIKLIINNYTNYNNYFKVIFKLKIIYVNYEN